MNARIFLRILAVCFGWLVYTLPEDYWPAGRAFLFSLINGKPDCERPVPREILGTIALAVLSAINPYVRPSYEEAMGRLNSHQKPVSVQLDHYPKYRGTSCLVGYEKHPHYYVMEAFVAYPQGDGYWLIEDRYDWHFPTTWSLPDCVARFIPSWVLSLFCKRRGRSWLLSEVGMLDRLTVPYWHRSIVRLSDYLSPDSLNDLQVFSEDDDWPI